ncbi:MAG: hypothetical protein KBD27_00225 [Candidatus Moranbacteria bacterium]|nr:hypothetical protein [Candidatus Moranbacteria bacterium]
MSLKLLMIPFSIIVVFTLVIGFIKPDIGLLQDKKSLYATKLDQAKNMGTLLSNIDALGVDLESKREVENSVIDYFPKQMDQDRVIDILNFLASQSGVAVVIMKLEEVGQQALVADAGEAVVATEVDANGVPLAIAPVVNQPVRLKTFSARVTVKGRYENMKDFFQRLAHMNRMHKTRYFFLEEQALTDDPEKAGEVGVLTGAFEADFDYFDARVGQDALQVAVFSRGAFDMTPFEKMSAWVTELVPPLEKPETGRPNPFQ